MAKLVFWSILYSRIEIEKLLSFFFATVSLMRGSLKRKNRPPMPDQHILTEKSKNKTTTTEQSTASTSELAKLNSKMDMIMKTLVLMDKRLTLVEDQLRNKMNLGENMKIKRMFCYLIKGQEISEKKL